MKLPILIWTAFLFLNIGSIIAQESTIQHFSFPADGKLSPEMIANYKNNGFLILDNYLTPEECDRLVAETDKLISEFKPTSETTAVFTAKNDAAENRGKYFEDSIDKISFFFEEKAFKDGELIVEKSDAINKLGHAVGERNDKFRAVTFRDSIRNIAEQLGVSDPRLNQSMIICKPKHIGGEVSPHQDSTFLYTIPNTTVAFWMPLQDATPENACLWGIPESHKWDLLARYVKNPSGRGFITVDMKGNPLTDPEITTLYNSHWPAEDFVAMPMKRGSVIIFPGTFVHRSSQNISDKSRIAYTFHIISGNSEYPADNWLQRSQFASFVTR